MSSRNTASPPTVLLFTRRPDSTGAKTRLRQSGLLSETAVQQLHSTFVINTLKTIRRSELPLHVAWHPDVPEYGDQNSEKEFHFAQTGSNFSDRIANAVQTSTGNRDAGILLIGSDCPYLTSDVLLTAASTVRSGSVVIGPNSSNGFYLLGLNQEVSHKDFSGCFHADCQVKALQQIFQKNTPTLLPELCDIDTIEDCVQLVRNFSNDQGGAQFSLSGYRSILREIESQLSDLL